jgi:hypothetical protein
MPEEPLDILPSGRYVVIVDVNGNTVWLEEPTGSAILQHDGDQFYWADGSAEAPLNFNPAETSDDVDVVLGLQSGVLVGIVNDTDEEMVLMSSGGKWELKPASVEGLPADGFGVAVKNSEAEAPEWINGPNRLVIFSEDNIPSLLAPGANGMILTVLGGIPQWALPNQGAIASGISATGLEGVIRIASIVQRY